MLLPPTRFQEKCRQHEVAAMNASRRYHTTIGPASLILGPAMMSVGDLLHPKESWDSAAQIAFIAAAPARWYVAHLLLFIGMLLFIPGILALTSLVADRRPGIGYGVRVLMLAGVGALSAVFGFEMLLGRLIDTGIGHPADMALLETFMGPTIFAVLGPALLAFFLGSWLAVGTLASRPGPLRAPALIFGLGTVLILAEIISAQVLLSQVGNVCCLGGGVLLARAVIRGGAV